MPYSQNWEEEELQETLTIGARAMRSAFYVSLHAGFPGFDGQDGNEVAGGGYARQQIASGNWTISIVGDHKRAALNTDITWTKATANYAGGALIDHFGFWDDASLAAATNFMGWHALANAKPVSTDQTPRIQSGQLTLTHGGT